MQEQEVEVSFCDLCGTSVPAGDIDAGTAVLHEGKTIGRCCLAALRGAGQGASSGGNPGGGGQAAPANGPVAADPASRSAGSRAVGSDGGRVMTIAIVLLVALAGGVMFLDSRLSRLEDALVKTADEASARQNADSDALQGLALKADGFAARADTDAVAAKASALEAAIATLGQDAVQRQKVLEQEVGGLRTQVNDAMSKVVDYRPLFEDLRQRHTRVLAAIEGMRLDVAAVPASAQPIAPPVAVVSEPVIDLPAALAEQVQRLGAADPAVRFEAVDVLVESKNAKALPYLLPLAKDPDPFVRRLTVEGLGDFKKPEVVDALIEALGDEDENVCDTAWTSLRDLTGQKFKFQASASKEARARAAQAWRDWWAKARATFGS